MKNNGKIPGNEMVNMFNYNVSNVDNIYLPLAMEANDAWVVPQKGNRTGWVAGKIPMLTVGPAPSTRSNILQEQIGKFTADNDDNGPRTVFWRQRLAPF